MNYREISLKDVDRLVEKYIHYHNSEGGKWTEETARKRLYQCLSIQDFYGLLIEEEKDIIGFVVGHFKTFDDLTLYHGEELLIFREYQNKKFGTNLMKELEKRVLEKGAKKINLLTTYQDNHQRFYKNLGFEPSDFLVPMRKDLI